MANTQVRVELIHHARGHYLAVAGCRYMVKTRKQGKDSELIYWKCTEKDTEDNLVTGFPKNHNHPPAPSDINAKKFMAHIKERACTSLDPIKF
jgi:RNase H-fold protein (predicted Holliday junction resolvase)